MSPESEVSNGGGSEPNNIAGSPAPIALRCENLSKRYRIGARVAAAETLAGAVFGWLRTPLTNLRALRRLSRFGEQEAGDDILWALRDVSFEITEGEVVGIIGRNGAGKSTLLKILSRITVPTGGRATIYGRVASLLEVGTGFHQELTGRENVYLNGSVLGLSKKEIDAKFDEIVDFSGVERFLDTPIKRFSSGMKVRLAFAVAAHLKAEILLIDEVLAVGDAAFQRKCLGKMGEVARSGRTVLFVSHNLLAVEKLCSRTIWFEGGSVRRIGETGEVVAAYQRTFSEERRARRWDDLASAPGNEQVRLTGAVIEPEGGNRITIRTPLIVTFDYVNLKPGTKLNLSLHLYNDQGVVVFNSASIHEPNWHGRPFPRGRFSSTCRIPGDLLNDGVHRIELLFVEDEGKHVWRQEDLVVFDVHDDVELRGGWLGKRPGAVRPLLEWRTIHRPELDAAAAGGVEASTTEAAR